MKGKHYISTPEIIILKYICLVFFKYYFYGTKTLCFIVNIKSKSKKSIIPFKVQYSCANRMLCCLILSQSLCQNLIKDLNLMTLKYGKVSPITFTETNLSSHLARGGCCIYFNSIYLEI